MVTQMCVSVTLYIHCLSCSKDFNNHCHNSLNPETLVMLLLFRMVGPFVPVIDSAAFVMVGTL